MFARFFAAVRSLTEAAEGLASSVREADDRFRQNVLSDAPGRAAPPLEIPHRTDDNPAETAGAVRENGAGRRKAKRGV